VATKRRPSKGKGGPRPLAAKVPRILPRHNTPRARAYRAAYVCLAALYGTPAPLSVLGRAMMRAALAQRDWEETVGALEAARVFPRLLKKRSAAEATAARLSKARDRADEALSRALGDLRAVLPPPVVLTKQERETAAFNAARAAHYAPVRTTAPGAGA
jgi:hypothetical protein